MTARVALTGRSTPRHPLARLGAFVVACATASLVAESVVYPVVVRGLALVGIHGGLGPWLGAAAVLAGTSLTVGWGEAVGTSPWRMAAIGGGAWRAGPLAVAFAGGMGTIGLTIALLLAIGGLTVVHTPSGDAIGDAGRALLTLAPAALLEELAVRGYALTVLAEWLGWPVAMAVSSVLFGALHVLNPGATVLSVGAVTMAGLALAAVRWRTGSLAAAWAFHLGWNLMMVAVAHVAVSGLAFPTAGWRLEDAGPAWLTGGAWGPEGGLLAFALLGGLTALLLRGGRLSAVPTTTTRPAGRMESIA